MDAEVARLRASFRSGKSLDLEWRKAQINGILRMVTENTDRLVAALKADLGVNDFWANGVEVAGIIGECKHMLSNLSSWTAPESVGTPLLSLPASSSIVPEPYGVCLIISPWNYPMSLLLVPMANAFAAGNVVVAKPSEVSENSTRAMAELLPKYVDASGLAWIEGAAQETTELLKNKFDLIMYTGSGVVGRVVMRAAADHLTPVILELGGKCPAIVHPDANIDNVAKRIVWGKWSMNNGQTCISPDYVITTKANKDKVVQALCKTVLEFYGPEPAKCPDISRMINARHTARVAGLLEDKTIKVEIGGVVDLASKFIAPTIVSATPASKVMQDEIFGPILPVIAVDSMAEAIEFVNDRDKPLALYLFTNNSEFKSTVLRRTSAGGVCVNDVIMHASNMELPFGGVGPSGCGAYHGKHGFDAFSHRKPVLEKYGSDPSLRYPPYTPSKISQLKFARNFNVSLSFNSKYLALLAVLIGAAVYFKFFRSAL